MNYGILNGRKQSANDEQIHTNKYIEREKLGPSVGVGDNNPSIKYLKNGHEKDTEPDNIEFSDFENAYRKIDTTKINLAKTDIHNNQVILIEESVTNAKY